MAIGQSAELLFRISGDASGASAAIRQTTVDLQSLQRTVSTIGPIIQNVGAGIQRLGVTLTTAITAPLAALGALGIQSALSFDQVRTKITALVGDSEAAAAKIADLTALAERSVGVTRSAALESFAQLRGIGDISDDTINKVIASLGKLNAAFNLEDVAGFQRNLVQIFDQGFERADIKEAIGRVPFFEQLLEQAFGTKDAEKLKKLKEAGELSRDAFLSGLTEAIDNDPRIANITENFGTQLAKGAEKIQAALTPLGDAILKIIVPAFNAIIPYIQKASELFAGLSEPVQVAVLAIAALAAAAGPVLIVLGGLVTAIGSIVAAAIPLGIALLAVVGVLIQLGPVLAVVIAQWTILADAWERDANGIRTATLEAFDAIRNGIQSALAAIRQFWNDHGAQILGIVTNVWSAIRRVVDTGLGVVAGVIRTVLAVIRGDWSAAWDGFLDIVRNMSSVLVQIWRGIHTALGAILANIVQLAINMGIRIVAAMQSWAVRAVVAVVTAFRTLPQQLVEIVPAMVRAGFAIGAAIIQGIKDAVSGSLGASLGALGDGFAGGTGLAGSIGAIAGGGGIPSVGGLGRGGGGGASATDKREEEEKKRLERLRTQIQQETELREARDRYELALLEYKFAQGELTEREFIEARKKLELDFLFFKEEMLKRELAAVRGRVDEEVRLNNELKINREAINTVGLDQGIEQIRLEAKEAAERSEETRKELEEQNRIFREQLRIRRQTLEVEREIADRRAEATRKVLQENVDLAGNRPERNAAAIALRDFEIAEADRRRRQIQEDLEFEKNAAIARLTAKELELGRREELEELYRQRAILADEEFHERLLEISRNAAATFESEGGILAAIEAGIARLGENITFIDLATEAFNNLANGIANAIQQYVLYGKTAPQALRQVLAATLAQIAAEAAIQAIRAAAYGFLFLATGNYVAAGNAFASAALWGAIAVGAALLGRAIAPKQQQAAARSGFSSQSSSASTRNSDGQGRVFSSNQDAIAETSVNSPSTRGVTVNSNMTVYLKDDSTWLGKMLQVEVDKNGPGRAAILRVAESV